LDTAKSVNHNQGTGWRLQPVLSISNGATVLGIFRGNLTVSSSIGVGETLLQLYSDNTARMKVSHYPNYTLWSNYEYNSIRRELLFTNTRLEAPGLGRRELREVVKRMPSQIVLPVKQWSLDNIIAIDTGGVTVNLYRVDGFDFSPGVTFTGFTLNIDYPDASKIGKDVITEVRFIDTGIPPITIISTFDSSRITEIVEVPNEFIQGSNTRIRINSYLFESPEDMDTNFLQYGGFYSLCMVDSVASDTTDNPWQTPDVFTLVRNGENQEFTVSFKPRLNIKMHHENFTNNNPVITWDNYPGASNGYFVLVLTEDYERNTFDDGNDAFAIAYYASTKTPQVRVYSDRVKFTSTYTTVHEIPPSIDKGDIIRIEVFVLDGSGSLDTVARKGAFFMDSVTIRR
jgi:hypothetical protein